jgi:hypothetical protein
MRNGQNNKRMRGRNRGKGGGGHHHHHQQNPLSRMYESNGPDVKIRGNASHIAEKYLQLARDAQSSGDPIASESYYQYAEHYFRLIAAAQENQRQNQPSYYPQQPGQPGGTNGSDDSFDDEGDDQPNISGEPYAPAPQQQPFYPQQQPQQQNFQPQQPHQPQQQNHQPQQQNYQPRPQQNVQQNDDESVDRLPSFITGGQAPQQPQQQYAPQGQSPNGQNGNGNGGYEGQADRFPLHRRRRRHRSGPRDNATQGDAPGDQGGAEE